MSVNPIQFILDNINPLVAALTRTATDIKEGDDFISPLLGFIGEFAEFDLVKILTDFAVSTKAIVASGQVPYIAGFLLADTVSLADSHGADDERPPVGRVRRSAPPDFVKLEGDPVAPSGYMSPEEAYSSTVPKVPKTTATVRPDKPLKLTKASSALMIDDEALNAALSHITTTHSAITIVTSIIAVVAEIASAGQLDEILAAVQSVYTLFDEPAAFYRLRDTRVDITYARPYRYMLEAELLNVLPPPADLGRFLAKELILPKEYDKTMTYWGIAEYYSDLYRRARYIELPAQTIYELLHKGIIDDEKAENLLRIADYNPSQIDNLVELSYDLPNRTEIRVMKRRTSIPDELVTKALDASGLKAEYQPYLLEMLDNWDLTSIQKGIINESMRQYVKGFLQEQDFLTVALDNMASETEAQAYLIEATIKREGRRKTDRVKTIRKAFKNGLLVMSISYQDEIDKYFPDTPASDITEIEIYFALMLELGFNQIDIEIMLDKDRIDSKDVAFIESMSELIAGITDESPFDETPDE